MIASIATLLLLLLLLCASLVIGQPDVRNLAERCGRVRLEADEPRETLADAADATGRYARGAAIDNAVGSHPDCACEPGFGGALWCG